MSEALQVRQPQQLLPATRRETVMQAFRNLSSSELFDSIVCSTFDDAVVSQSPTLHEASAGGEKDRMRTLLYISAAIANFLNFKNRRKNMNDMQIAETATLILEEFPYLKMTDIRLFIRRLKCNAYGEVYDLDGQSIIGWLNKYVEEKRMAQYRIYQQREQEQKAKADKENEEYYNSPEGKAAQAETAKLIEEICKKFKPNKKKQFNIEQPTKPKDYRQLRIEAIRKQVIAEKSDYVLKYYQDNYIEIMNSYINDALKAEGLKD